MKIMYKVVCHETGEVYNKYYTIYEAARHQARVLSVAHGTNWYPKLVILK